jgi:uncharacterized protein YbbK (DUF523 family)
VVTNKPTLLISRCLLGETVRYDGRSKGDLELVTAIEPHYQLHPICPEVEAGLSTPRPPVKLVQTGQTISARGRDEHSLDVTHQLQQFTTQFITQQPPIHGAILQNRSPSCGVEDTPLFSEEGEQLQTIDGLFTSALRATYPALPIASAETVSSPKGLQQFLNQVAAYYITSPR